MSIIRVRVAVLISKGDEVLLVQHQKDGKQYWLLPGGGLEFEESLEECAERELLEETNLRVKVGKLAFISETIAPDKTRHLVHMVFHAEVIGGQLKIGQEDRLLAVKYVNIRDLDKYVIHPPIAPYIAKYAGRPQERPEHLGILWRKEEGLTNQS